MLCTSLVRPTNNASKALQGLGIGVTVIDSSAKLLLERARSSIGYNREPHLIL